MGHTENDNNAAYHLEKAIEHLRSIETEPKEYLADLVASVCDITTKEMFSPTGKAYNSHVKWLYWYAYRHLTKETYERIAKKTEELFGKKYTTMCVASAANKMMLMIESEPAWKRRWYDIKKLISTNKTQSEDDEDRNIVIQVPKGMKDKFNITIKER